MKGKILGLPTDTQKGVISSESGERFKFEFDDIRAETPLKTGEQVDFDAKDGAAKDIFPDFAVSQSYSPTETQGARPVARVYRERPPISQVWFSFQGRSPRYDLWIRTYLPLIGAVFVTTIIDLASGTATPEEPGVLTSLLMLLSIWPVLAVSLKRLKDMNYSPWLYLLVLVPIANIVIIVMIMFVPGTVGDNKYGPDPLDRVE